MVDKKFFTEVVLLTKSYNLQDFKDWLHWHMDIIGFQRCHVFDNESSVDIKTECQKYGERVTYELVKGWPNQYALYNRYINNESPAWWVLPIDDDEFLWMKSFKNVNNMLWHYTQKWPEMNKLSIRWENKFPKHPKASRGAMSLMDFNTESNNTWANLFVGGNKPVKTFVLTTAPVIYSEATAETHNPITGIKSFLCNGERLQYNWYYGPDTDNDLKLLHYQYKSADEWIWKCKHRLSIFGKTPYIYTQGQEDIIEKMI